MTDPTVDAYDRLDRLHRTYPLSATCIACRSHPNSTTSADGLCHACRCDIRTIQLWSSE